MIPIHELPDSELTALLRTDGEAAFRAIYDRYWDKLYFIARKRLNDDQDAEEIVQDIFSKLWRRREKFKMVDNLNNYFAVAIRYEVINHVAKQTTASAYEKELAHALSEIDETTLHQLSFKEMQRHFDDTVNALPEKCRIVFKMQHDLGYSQQKIADELEISTKTVEAHLSKARKTLRDVFGNYLGLFL